MEAVKMNNCFCFSLLAYFIIYFASLPSHISMPSRTLSLSSFSTHFCLFSLSLTPTPTHQCILFKASHLSDRCPWPQAHPAPYIFSSYSNLPPPPPFSKHRHQRFFKFQLHHAYALTSRPSASSPRRWSTCPVFNKRWKVYKGYTVEHVLQRGRGLAIGVLIKGGKKER